MLLVENRQEKRLARNRNLRTMILKRESARGSRELSRLMRRKEKVEGDRERVEGEG